MKKDVKKALKEAKEQKDKKLIEQTIIESRLIMAVGSTDKVKNYKSLSIKERINLSIELLDEIATLQEQGLVINEGLGDLLGTIFGSSWSGLLQTVAEPLVNSILSGLGMQDTFFKDFLISLFTKNLGRLAKALRGDCRELTALVAESIVEGMVMKLQYEKGFTSGGWVFLRNALADALHETTFVKKLEEQMESTICGIFGKLTDKASEVVDKLKGGSSSAPTAVPAA